MTTDWMAFCRRTNDPKLRRIEGLLDELGIAHRRHGESYHAPILEVPAADHDRAYTEVLLKPDAEYGIFDDVPDDDPRFSLQTNFSSHPTLDAIRSLEDLAAFLGTDRTDLRGLNRRLFKDTSAGQNLAVEDLNARWRTMPADADWSGPIQAFVLGAICEQCDATWRGDYLPVGTPVRLLSERITSLDQQVDAHWLAQGHTITSALERGELPRTDR